MVRLSAPELVPAPPELRRADGHSIYEPHEADRYATTWHIRAEEAVVAAARSTDGPSVEPEVAEPLIAGTELSPSQAEAVRQLLTSGRQVEPMIGYGGVGKTYTTAELARLWTEATGKPALGLTTAEAARQVLAKEGFEHSANIARFLDAQQRIEAGKARLGDEQYRLVAGQLVVVDEASMVTTAHMAEIIQASRGGRGQGRSDRRRSPALSRGQRRTVPLISLKKLRRTASTRCGALARSGSGRPPSGLRAGDPEVLAEYDRRGRIHEGSRSEMIEVATRRAVASHLRGETVSCRGRH